MTAVQEPAAEREIGRERRRKEDQRLITGRTRWTDNIALPGMLHLAMVRSPFAHAKILSIDTSEAKNATNVVDVVTGADLGEAQGACINAWAITEDQVTPPHLPMPVDRVAFAGEVVAVVVARSAAEARDAAELVDVEYDELPAALDLKHAATDEVLAHPDLGTNKSAFWRFDSAEASTGGDVEAAIDKARTDGIVIEREYRQQRLIPAFMEPRSVVVDPTGEQITVWSATQVPHILRFAIAATAGVPESKIRVIAPDVGGGFGGKLQQTPEEMIAFAVARRLGRPVKFTETRSESLMTAHHGRDQWQKLTMSAEKDGTVTGLKVELLADLGAYVAIVGGGVPVLDLDYPEDSTAEADANFSKRNLATNIEDASLYARHLIRASRPREAASLLEPLVGMDRDHMLWPYLSLAWRLLNDERWQWLEGDPRLIGTYNIAKKFGDMNGLAKRLRELHVSKAEPLDQSVRGGTQTDGNLLLRTEPVFRRLRRALMAAVDEHVRQLPAFQANHPTLLKNREPRRISGSWSVRLSQTGHHVDHVHSQGWLSSAFYVALPPKSTTADQHDGWLALGECRELAPSLAPYKLVEPKVGQLVLFPSTMWHGTRPFPSGERMSVAFDVARPRQSKAG